MKRKKFSPKVKAGIVSRQGGICPRSGVPLVPGQINFDHRVPLALGGADDVSNLEALAVPAHREKTKGDVKRIAKAKRIEKKHKGLKRKPRFAWPSRKISGWRKFDGTAVRRNPT